jgi:integrase
MTFQHLGKDWTLSQKRPGGPLYFSPRWGDRGQKVWHCMRDRITNVPYDKAAAIAAARDLITARFKGPDQYQALRDQTKLRDTTTVASILEQWIASGYAQANGRPRPAGQSARHAEVVKYPRQWFADKTVASITEPVLVKYAHWRRGQVREGFAGDRITDRELNTLAQCFHWATAAGHAEKNPFAERPRFHTADQVKHSPAFMPRSGDELHRLCGHLFATGEQLNIVAGAQLLFMAMTGLRAGEPGFLRWNARDTDDGHEPGHRFTRTIDGQSIDKIAVHRLKGGINPAVQVRPALAAFLEAWQPYCRMHWPDSPFWFPHPHNHSRPLVLPEDPTDALGYRLQSAAAALKVPHRKAHAMRAYYVHVRTSQNASDGIIADELGDASGAPIIVTCYGKADAGKGGRVRGDARFDWLPSPDSQTPIVWTLLDTTATNVIAL